MSLAQRLIACLLLLAYASTGTALFPAAVMALAELDGSHEVVVIQGEAGTQVRLHHDEHGFTPHVEDHHDVLARALVSMCCPATEGDHSLSTAAISAPMTLSRDDHSCDAKGATALNAAATTALVFALPAATAQSAQAVPAWPPNPAPVLGEARPGVTAVRLMI